MKALRPVVAVGALLLLSGPAMAQERYATIDVRGGYTAAPSGSLEDQQAGQSFKGQSSFGVGTAISLASRLRLGLTFDWAHHSQKQPPDGTVVGGPNDPQYNVFHTFLKVSFDVVDNSNVTIGVNAGPGLMFFSPNTVLKANGARGDRHFAMNLGATVTWWFADRIGLVLSPQLDVAMSRASGQVFTDKSAMFMPLTGGFRFKI